MKSFAIGIHETERVAVNVLGYARPATGERYDDNWLRCDVSVDAGAFSGRFEACFLTFEREELWQGLGTLHRELRGDYRFEPLEGQLLLRIGCNPLGHVHLNGEARDPSGTNRLVFDFSLDQTYLAATLRALEDVLKAFPTRT